MNRTQRSVALLVAAAFSATLAGCGGGLDNSDGSGGDAGSGTVHIGIGSDPNSLDPALVASIQDAYVLSPAYQTLIKRTSAGEIVGGLATDWKSTPTTATFSLRPDVTCSDGTKLTATMAAKSIARLADPATRSNGAHFAFGGGTVTAVGDDSVGKVTVTNSKPWSDLLVGFSQPWTAIICPSGLQDPASLARTSAGTGPYTLSEAVPGQHFTFTRRVDYPKPDASSGSVPQTIEYNVVTDKNTMTNELLSKQLDAALLIDPDVSRLKGDPSFSLDPIDAGSSILLLNESKGRPTADPKVRAAIMQAIDKRAFNSATWQGNSTIISGLATDGTGCPDVSSGLPGQGFDPGAAKATLSALGVKLKVVGTSQVGGGQGTSYVAAALKDAGVEVKLANTDTTNWITTLTDGANDWDVTVLYAANLAGTMSAIGSYFTGPPPPGGTNFANIANGAFDSAFAEATTAQDATGACGAWLRATADLLNRSDIKPLSGLLFELVWSKNVTGDAPYGVIDADSLRMK